MSVSTYLAYLAVVAVFFAHPPGPSQLLFMAHSLRYGVRGASPTMAGDLSANAIQIVVAGFGLAGVVAQSADVFTAVKWAGVVYLACIGMRTLLTPTAIGAAVATRNGALFRKGFITSAANPYAVMFFAALFPQFIDAAHPLAPQIAILGVTYIIFDAAILVLLGLAAHRAFRLLGGRFQHWANRVSGVMMIAAAVLLSFKVLTPAETVSAR